MRKSSRNFRLVSLNDPAKIFDDLEALRTQNKNSAPYRRRRLEETFARIPHDRALTLYRYVGEWTCPTASAWCSNGRRLHS